MRRLSLLVLLVLTGCSVDHSGYFYVDKDGNGYRCMLNDVHASALFHDVHKATFVCDELNKTLGPNADTIENDAKYFDHRTNYETGVPAAAF